MNVLYNDKYMDKAYISFWYFYRLAGTVEAFVSKMGVQIPVLTPEQQDLTKIRWTASMVCSISLLPFILSSVLEAKWNMEKKIVRYSLKRL